VSFAELSEDERVDDEMVEECESEGLRGVWRTGGFAALLGVDVALDAKSSLYATDDCRLATDSLSYMSGKSQNKRRTNTGSEGTSDAMLSESGGGEAAVGTVLAVDDLCTVGLGGSLGVDARLC
jgi:hypothetical protein